MNIVDYSTSMEIPTMPSQNISFAPGRKLSEIDDLENELERELEELDDVEPEDMFHFGTAAAAAAAASDPDEPPALPVRQPAPPPQQAATPEKKVEALQFVRRADGKGFVRKGGGGSTNKGGLSTKIRVALKVTPS